MPRPPPGRRNRGWRKAPAFSPDAPCTRLMAVEFMWKYADSPEAPKATFADVASDAVNWAVKQGVTNGTSATTFSPGNRPAPVGRS